MMPVPEKTYVGLTNERFDSSKEGKGASAAGKIIAIVTTIFQLIGGVVARSDVMKNYGRQLSSTPVINFLDNLKTNNKTFDFDPTYSVLDFEGNENQVGSLKSAISKFYKNTDLTKFAIPITFPPLTPFEEKHIVLIFVDKEAGTLEYFDSKGITSENRQLTTKQTMDTVLQQLAISDLDKPLKIKENAKVIQKDCHNCGAYVSWLAQERLKLNTMEDVINKKVTLEEIRLLRQGMTFHQFLS